MLEGVAVPVYTLYLPSFVHLWVSDWTYNKVKWNGETETQRKEVYRIIKSDIESSGVLERFEK